MVRSRKIDYKKMKNQIFFMNPDGSLVSKVPCSTRMEAAWMCGDLHKNGDIDFDRMKDLIRRIIEIPDIPLWTGKTTEGIAYVCNFPGFWNEAKTQFLKRSKEGIGYYTLCVEGSNISYPLYSIEECYQALSYFFFIDGSLKRKLEKQIESFSFLGSIKFN